MLLWAKGIQTLTNYVDIWNTGAISVCDASSFVLLHGFLISNLLQNTCPAYFAVARDDCDRIVVTTIYKIKWIHLKFAQEHYIFETGIKNPTVNIEIYIQPAANILINSDHNFAAKIVQKYNLSNCFKFILSPN